MWTDIKVLESTDKNVKKYIFEKEDASVESVLYKYPTYKERTVICCLETYSRWYVDKEEWIYKF